MACVHYWAGGSWVCTATGQCFTSLNLSVPICTMGTMTPISQRYGLHQWEPFPPELFDEPVLPKDPVGLMATK